MEESQADMQHVCRFLFVTQGLRYHSVFTLGRDPGFFDQFSSTARLESFA